MIKDRGGFVVSEYNRQDLEGQLDLTSDPATPPRSGDAPKSDKKARQEARAYFKCCRVYSVVTIPDGVLNGKLSSWRFHCPRCGRLSEIPL